MDSKLPSTPRSHREAKAAKGLHKGNRLPISSTTWKSPFPNLSAPCFPSAVTHDYQKKEKKKIIYTFHYSNIAT